ncbi:unnamed protein product [Brachionus calyciflorus]|uniref:C2H2-type domain-containing protein n=1 Tax=Brachionus calyciflorus TaxID=104777 RepID=A0A813PV32_9BILA|nr:unnamed protein product [Brachionus calyciflorus]
MSMDTSFNCPLCFKLIRDPIERHFNLEHGELECPFCNKIYPSQVSLNEHLINVHNETNLGLKIDKEKFTCPVCSNVFVCQKDLEAHVESHFDQKEPSFICLDDENVCGAEASSDYELARKLENEELIQMENGNNFQDDECIQYESDSYYAAELEHEFLKKRFGMTNSKASSKAISSLNQAYKKNKMDALTYHNQKELIETKINSIYDDNSTSLNGIIEIIEQFPLGKNTTSRYLSSKCSLFTSGFIDKSYGCGFRNTQMLLSCIREDPKLKEVIFNNRKIQQIIEKAWAHDFDIMGKNQLGGVLYNTTKWIGASDVAAMFSFLGIKTELVDITRSRHATNPNLSVAEAMFDYVYNYFVTECQKSDNFVYPIYVQHDGHSRTIVGIENGKNKNFILFDPGSNKKEIEEHVKYNPTRLLTLLRRSLTTFNRNREYQLLIVRGKFDTNEEYEAAKILKSTRIEV